jgi:hypothetical protein
MKFYDNSPQVKPQCWPNRHRFGTSTTPHAEQNPTKIPAEMPFLRRSLRCSKQKRRRLA